MARGTPFFYGGFVGGLNTTSSVFEIEDHQARDLLNVSSDSAGAIRKRNGSSSLVATAGAIKTLAAIESTNPVTLLLQRSTKWYSTSGSAPTDITGGATVTSGLPWAVVQAQAQAGQGPAYMCNGTDTPLQWTGSGNVAAWTASSGTLPNGTQTVYAGNRLWIAGMTAGVFSDPTNTVAFSALPDSGGARAWPVNNYVIVGPNDGDHIVGLGIVEGFVVVFKRRSVWVIYDLNTGYVRQISSDVGCIAPRSIASGNNRLFFRAASGVYEATSQGVGLISYDVTPTLAAGAASRHAEQCGVVYNNHYYLSYSVGGSVNDFTLDYDIQLKSWWLHSFGVAQFALWKATNQIELYGAPNASRIDKLMVPSVYADSGTGYAAYWTTNWQSPMYYRRRRINAPDTRKRLRQLRLDGAGAFAVNLSTDFIGTAFQHLGDFSVTGDTSLFGSSDTGTFGPADTGTFGTAAAIGQQRLYGRGGANVARAFSYQFISPASSTGGWQLEAYEAFIDPRTN